MSRSASATDARGRRMARIYVVGTADTKGEELAFLADGIRAAAAIACVVDVGTRAPTITTDVAAEIVAAHGATRPC